MYKLSLQTIFILIRLSPALGFGTALLGKEAAMACTVAVEDSICAHYSDQLRHLLEDASRYPDDPGEKGIQMKKRYSSLHFLTFTPFMFAEKHRELLDIIKKFRDDEMDHHDTGLAHDAEKFPGYNILFNVIKAGCKVAIVASEKI